MRAILESGSIDIGERQFVSLVAALEVAVTAGAGDRMVEDAERRRLDEGYTRARSLVAQVRIPSGELGLAA